MITFKTEPPASDIGTVQVGGESEKHPAAIDWTIAREEDKAFEAARGPLLVEVVSEGPHCVPCEYAIAAVEHVSELYKSRIKVKVLETKSRDDAIRYLELCASHGGKLPIPAILFNGRLVFDDIPGPDELCDALDEALSMWESVP